MWIIIIVRHIETLGVFDLKRHCAEWSVYDFKVPRELLFESIRIRLVSYSPRGCHTLIILHSTDSSRTHLMWQALVESPFCSWVIHVLSLICINHFHTICKHKCLNSSCRSVGQSHPTGLKKEQQFISNMQGNKIPAVSPVWPPPMFWSFGFGTVLAGGS